MRCWGLKLGQYTPVLVTATFDSAPSESDLASFYGSAVGRTPRINHSGQVLFTLTTTDSNNNTTTAISIYDPSATPTIQNVATAIGGAYYLTRLGQNKQFGFTENGTENGTQTQTLQYFDGTTQQTVGSPIPPSPTNVSYPLDLSPNGTMLFWAANLPNGIDTDIDVRLYTFDSVNGVRLTNDLGANEVLQATLNDSGQMALEYFIIGTSGDPKLQNDISIFIDPVLGTTPIASHNIETDDPGAPMGGGLDFVAMNNQGLLLTTNGLWQNGSIVATLQTPAVPGTAAGILFTTELNLSGQSVGVVELYAAATQTKSYVPVVWDAKGNAINFTVDEPNPDPAGTGAAIFVSPVGINDAGQILAIINPEAPQAQLIILNPPAAP